MIPMPKIYQSGSDTEKLTSQWTRGKMWRNKTDIEGAKSLLKGWGEKGESKASMMSLKLSG